VEDRVLIKRICFFEIYIKLTFTFNAKLQHLHSTYYTICTYIGVVKMYVHEYVQFVHFTVIVRFKIEMYKTQIHKHILAVYIIYIYLRIRYVN